MKPWDFTTPPESEITDRQVALEGNHLEGKRIALLVTGSIAAIKAPLIARSLRRQGADVVAFASAEALRYTTIEALAWSTTNPVITKLTPAAEHLSDEQPFAAYLVAPATYNTINKISCGIADSVVTAAVASALGRMERGKTQVLIAPTMHGSLHNSILTASLYKLQIMGVKIITPTVAYGKNLLPPEAAIVAEVARSVSSSVLKDIPILVTGGTTPVPIDNVRRLTNRFTGRLGGYIAEELDLRGAAVKLICGQGGYTAPEYLPHREIFTYSEYKAIVLAELASKQYKYGIFSAAVADYEPDTVFPGKIPSGDALQTINLVPTTKVIAEVRDSFPDLYMVTFKYQENIDREQLMAIAHARLQQGYQMVVANRGEETGAKGEQVAYLVTQDRPEIKAVGKPEIAQTIANYLETIHSIA
ncbi:MAG TPA: phosphopantothenoylcysteine decarboxylase [Xenococcaceae cyanobacterium]|jgi:phosphopantothenoylcysteine decarboxylase/phosphopantothenate--cysteine ligase